MKTQKFEKFALNANELLRVSGGEDGIVISFVSAAVSCTDFNSARSNKDKR